MKETKFVSKNEVTSNKMKNEINQKIQETTLKNPEVQSEVKEIRRPIQNKENGMAREVKVHKELGETCPESKGYKIHSEQYLRNDKGEIVKDPESKQGRRVDFMVEKDEKIIKSIEVTSKTAPKDIQMAKEQRIRDAGGNYIKTSDNRLLKLDAPTEIWRRK